MTHLYKIVRYRFHGDNEVVLTGLTLDEAQAHCNREDTHGDGWFDGYQLQNPSEQNGRSAVGARHAG